MCVGCFQVLFARISRLWLEWWYVDLNFTKNTNKINLPCDWTDFWYQLDRNQYWWIENWTPCEVPVLARNCINRILITIQSRKCNIYSQILYWAAQFELCSDILCEWYTMMRENAYFFHHIKIQLNVFRRELALITKSLTFFSRMLFYYSKRKIEY